MLTGEKIFKGETPPAVMMAHFKPLTLPEVWPEDVPPGVAIVLRTALAQIPEERYESATDMGRVLANLSSGQITGSAPMPAAKLETRKLDLPPPTEPAPQAVLPTGEGVAPPSPQTPPLWHQGQPPELPSVEVRSATPTPLPPPMTGLYERDREMMAHKHRRFGCLHKGTMLGLVITLLVFIGLASFCAAFGSNAGSNIAAPIESLTEFVGGRIQIGQVVTDTIHVPVPEQGGTTRLEIEFSAGTFTLGSGTQDALVDGTVTYNVDMLKPSVVVNGRNVRISPEGSTQDVLLLTVYNFFNTEIQNVWNLNLGNSPMNLNLGTGTSEGQIKFDKISLVDLTISQHAIGGLDLSFLEPNQVEMETLEFSGGFTKRTALTGLANARARNINLTAQTGEFTLDFGGRLQNDVNVSVTGATEASVNIIIPKGVATEVLVSDGVNNVDIPDDWQTEDGRRYIQSGQGHQIFIEIEGELYTLKLRSR